MQSCEIDAELSLCKCAAHPFDARITYEITNCCCFFPNILLDFIFIKGNGGGRMGNTIMER